MWRSPLLLCGAWLCIALACETDDKKTVNSCVEDSECGAGVCFDQRCYRTCEFPMDCEGDEFCVAKGEGESALAMCMSKSEYSGCEADDECPALVASSCMTTVCVVEEGLCDVAALPDGDACSLPNGASGSCQDGACECVPDC
jgi:hypothetical protein